jgi:hypothetical protein
MTRIHYMPLSKEDSFKRIPFVVKGDLGGNGSSPRNLHICRYRNPNPGNIESHEGPRQIRSTPAGPVWIHTV